MRLENDNVTRDQVSGALYGADSNVYKHDRKIRKYLRLQELHQRPQLNNSAPLTS